MHVKCTEIFLGRSKLTSDFLFFVSNFPGSSTSVSSQLNPITFNFSVIN